MALTQEFFDNLNKLENVKMHPNLKDFFDSVGVLEKLDAEICEFQDKKSQGVMKLNKQACVLAKKLEENKEAIAFRTKSQIEFDAVYYCIDYLNNLFCRPQ